MGLLNLISEGIKGKERIEKGKKDNKKLKKIFANKQIAHKQIIQTQCSSGKRPNPLNSISI